jgi:hypothetical protein
MKLGEDGNGSTECEELTSCATTSFSKKLCSVKLYCYSRNKLISKTKNIKMHIVG